MTVAQEYSKVVLGTGDREIQFFDMASFGPHCQINRLDSMPIDIHYAPLAHREREQCVIVYGDQQGCIGVLRFTFMARSLRCWKKLPKHEDFIASIPLDQAIIENDVIFNRWQVHKDWVNMVRYYPQTDQILSCSMDKNIPMVLASRRGTTNIARAIKDFERTQSKKFYGAYFYTRPRNPCDQIVFQVPGGVTCFDFCPELKMVVSGGLDRIVRIWNSFISRAPIGNMAGHYTPIKHIFLCHRSSRIFSMSGDRWIKVWHVYDHACLMTIPWHVHRMRGQLRAALYNSKKQAMAIVGDNISVLRVKHISEAGKSHKTGVACIVYNPHFNHLISASVSSEIRIWNLDTGNLEFEFGNAHGDHGVTDMDIDSTGRRLFTAGRDGCGKVWNYNNGHCLHTLEKIGSNAEIGTVLYIDMRLSRTIMMAGWTHRLNVYTDSLESIPFELPRNRPWFDDMVRGHKADVLCSDFCQPDLLATGGYDGKVCVWSMENSSRIRCFVPQPPTDWSQEKMASDCGVSCLKFLKFRAKYQRMSSIIVSGGPYGRLYMWSINRNALNAKFSPVEAEEEKSDAVLNIGTVDTDDTDETLVTGDSRGYVTVWDIRNYASVPEVAPPPVKVSWQAHLETLTGLRVVPGRPLLVTSANDCTVRLWTFDGKYIGTFGHHKKWTLDDDLSFRHPDVPSDIWESNLPPDYYEQKIKEAQKIPSCTEMDISTMTPETRKRMERYDAGLGYFARKKASIIRRKHLCDESMNLFSCVGNVSLYKNLRWHAVAGTPSTLPPKPKMAEMQYY